MSKAVALWKSYVGRGAPSNACGSRAGYGRTKSEATEAAGHWNNQAPWARLRRIDVCDQAGPSGLTTEEELAAWAVCGTAGEFVPPTERQVARERLIRAGKYASAILDYFAEKDARAEGESSEDER